ncbi:MAG: MFS transporter [Clostridia bacterium]|nr:MFS transporter [Clostridia bacterium]
MKFTFKHTKLACYTSYATSAIASNFPPVLFIIFQREFGLSLTALGTLISLNFGVQLLADMLGARYVNKIGHRTCAIFANFSVAAGVILMGVLPHTLAEGFLGFAIATITYAFGSGLLEVLISPIVEAIPGDEKAADMSFLHSFYCWGQLSAILVTTLFVYLFGGNNWQIICFFWSVVPIFSALLFCKVPIATLSGDEHKATVSIFKNKMFFVFLLLMTASGASEIVVSQWSSLFAETALGLSKTAGDLFGPCMFALLMGLGRIFYAKYSTKIVLSDYIMLCGSLCVLAYLVMSFVPNNYVSLASIGVIGFSVSVMWPGVLSLASEKFPRGGTAMFAYLAIFGDIGCTLGPGVAAIFSEKLTLGGSALRGGIAVCVIFPSLVVILTYIIKKMRS